MTAIYHLLEEAEPFSERYGGAISRWAANVLRDGPEEIVCPSFDDSWGFAAERLYRLPHWATTHRVHPILYRIPFTTQKAIYLPVFRPLLERMSEGDILYVHNKPVCAAVLATVVEKYGIRLVLHMHNSLLLRATKPQLAALRDTTIVFCSEFLRQEALEAIPNHFTDTHLVYNGADNHKFRVVGNRQNLVPKVIFTGRLVSYKGPHILMRAMRILQERGIEGKCTIVGGSGFGSDSRTSYIRKLERLRPSNTEMVGYKVGAEVAQLVRDADIFCCPSIWNDPFPLAPIEAMASGLPVVASHTGGIPEALAYGGGVLVPPDDPTALANALQKLIVNQPLRESLGSDALHAFQEHFLWGNVRDQYQLVIESLVK